MHHLKGLHLGLVFHRTSSLWINIPASVLCPSSWWICPRLDQYIAHVSLCFCMCVWHEREQQRVPSVQNKYWYKPIDLCQCNGSSADLDTMFSAHWMWTQLSEAGYQQSGYFLQNSTVVCGWVGLLIWPECSQWERIGHESVAGRKRPRKKNRGDFAGLMCDRKSSRKHAGKRESSSRSNESGSRSADAAAPEVPIVIPDGKDIRITG